MYWATQLIELKHGESQGDVSTSRLDWGTPGATRALSVPKMQHSDGSSMST